MHVKLKALTSLPAEYKSSILTEASRVFAYEIEGLQALSGSLDGQFVRAIDILMHVKGRTILTGMGKSGHIAVKIGATLSSTGQTSLFVHPAEASHGDLGMITPQDAVIALSNSGETAELHNVVSYTRRFEIPLIGITSRPNSTLAKVCDVALILPEVTEACPMGLAPTTSTTMMLALGDAIAMCLLNLRNFSPNEFQTFHPGGNLGARLSRVRDYMHMGQSIPLIGHMTIMSDALIEMTQKGFGCVGVLDTQEQIIGIITDGDLRRHLSPDMLRQKAYEVMSHDPLLIDENTLMEQALKILNDHKVTCLFITKEDTLKPVGIIHIHDLLRAGIT